MTTFRMITSSRGTEGSAMESAHKTVRPSKVEISGPENGYDGYFKLEKYEVTHERFDGSMSRKQTIEVFERGDAVSVLLVDPDNDELFLVEQFRLPARLRGGSGWLIEPPAGVIRKDEAPQDCIRREIIEETGYQVTELTEIARFFTSPGGTTERIFLFYAEVRATDKKGSGGGVLRDGEDIRIQRIKIDEFFAKLARREFEDAKLIIAGQWLQGERAKLPAEKLPTVSHTFDFRLRGTEKVVGYKTGSIIAVTDVDVWVNPTDCDMLMDPFRGRSVSAAIRLHGAEKYEDSGRIKDDTIAKALSERLDPRGFVRPKTVVDTIAGALERTHNVKRIFHVAVVPGAMGKFEKEEGPDTLERCVGNVLASIDSKNGGFFGGTVYESVLFPILGTGQGGYFNRDVIPRLAQRAIQYFKENPRSRLCKIYFCAYTQSDRDILENVLSACSKAPDGDLEKI